MQKDTTRHEQYIKNNSKPTELESVQ